MAFNNSHFEFLKKSQRLTEECFRESEFLDNEKFLAEFVGPNILVKDPHMAKRLFDIVSIYLK